MTAAETRRPRGWCRRCGKRTRSSWVRCAKCAREYLAEVERGAAVPVSVSERIAKAVRP